MSSNKDLKPANERLKVKGIKKPLISLKRASLLVNGKTFEKLKKQGESLTLYGYQYNRWKESLDMSQSLEKDLREKSHNIQFQFEAKAINYFETVQLPSLSLFIGFFIAVLFFTASGSFLYFRLFTDLEEDQERYRSLSKIGLSEKEMSQSVTIQLAILFFFPLSTRLNSYVFCDEDARGTEPWSFRISGDHDNRRISDLPTIILYDDSKKLSEKIKRIFKVIKYEKNNFSHYSRFSCMYRRISVDS